MILVYDSPGLVAEHAAAAVAWQVASKPASTIGLAGGGTPAATYRLLAEANIDWTEATLFLGDERWVPEDHEDSNTRMVRSTLGDAAERLVSPRHEDDPAADAADYWRRLEPHFESGVADLVMLGMGDDGHTASLFPGTSALTIEEPGFAANWVEDKDSWRLTATMPLLCAARKVLFLVAGVGKAPMIHRILEHEEQLPAQRVGACNPNVTWLLDTAAASHLS